MKYLCQILAGKLIDDDVLMDSHVLSTASLLCPPGTPLYATSRSIHKLLLFLLSTWGSPEALSDGRGFGCGHHRHWCSWLVGLVVVLGLETGGGWVVGSCTGQGKGGCKNVVVVHHCCHWTMVVVSEVKVGRGCWGWR